MVQRLLWTLIGVSGIANVAFALEGIYVNPDIHENTIVFQSNGKIWKGEIGAEKVWAYQIHDCKGLSFSPKISPNGSKVAFFLNLNNSASTEVYTIDLDGQNLDRISFEGVDNRTELSWHQDDIVFCGFSPKSVGDKTLKVANRITHETKEVGVSQCSQAVFVEDNAFYFTRFGQQSAVNRYRGGQIRQIYRGYKCDNQEISIKKVPLMEDANCTHPMQCRDDFYFLSDKEGKNRLYRFRETGITEIYKDCDYGISSASTDGNRIIFEVAGRLKVYDPLIEETSELDVELSGMTEQTTEWVEIDAEIAFTGFYSTPLSYFLQELMAADPSGEKILFLVRGSLIQVEKEKGGFKRIQPPEGGYYFDVAVCKGKTYALYGTKKGMWLQTMLEGKSERFFLSDRCRSKLVVSSDGNFVVTQSAQQQLFLLNLKTGEETQIAENLPHGKNVVSFSPDSKWIAYSSEKKNHFCSLKVYSVDEKKSFSLTQGEVDGVYPVWHPKQAALYFMNRNVRSLKMGSALGSSKIFSNSRSVLCAVSFNQNNPFENPNIKEIFDLNEGVFSRKVYKNPDVMDFDSIRGTKRGLILLGRYPIFMSFEEGKREEASLDVADVYCSAESNKGVVIDRWGISWADFSTSLEGCIESEVKIPRQSILIDNKKEMEALFNAIHRVYKSFFYDQNLGDTFWDEIRYRYQPLLTRVRSKSDLMQVVSWMLAELETMHIFVVGPGFRGNYQLESVGLPIDTVYNADKSGLEILRKIEIDPLIDDRNALGDYGAFQAGMVIKEINSQPVEEMKSLAEQLVGAYASTVHFELIDLEGKALNVDVVPLHYADLCRLWMHDWAYRNRLEVDQKSSSEIGYIHLSGMMLPDYAKFTKLFSSMSDKKGLILDLRFNHGGFIHHAIIEAIGQPSSSYSRFYGEQSPIDTEDCHPKIVVLCNQQTCSDGEMVISLLKKSYDVTVVGTKTWGGGVGIIPMLGVLPNATLVTVPGHASYDKGTSEVLVEGKGAAPIDIYLDMDPRETYVGNDTQLAKALEILLESIYEDVS
ncbi:MAG: S41 family peptidase [Chlamydiia bacterium]